MVSPSAFEEPLNAALCAGGQQGDFCKLYLDGLASVANKDFLPRINRKLRSYAKLARTTPEGITVVSPAALPFFGSAGARTVNRHLIGAQIGALARSRGLSRPILWIAIPTAVEMIGRFDESLVIYHVSDKYDAQHHGPCD